MGYFFQLQPSAGLLRVSIPAVYLVVLPIAYATPITPLQSLKQRDDEPSISPDNSRLWIYFTVAGVLVLLGGAFAGLTVALMGQVCLLKYDL